MQEVFEKIIEKLKNEKLSYFLTIANTGNKQLDSVYEKVGDSIDNAIEIVKQTAAEYNNGWIPCSEPPKTSDYILLSFSNFSVPMVGRYEENEDGGAYYIGDEDKSCVSQDIFVNAWQPLPEQYNPKGE